MMTEKECINLYSKRDKEYEDQEVAVKTSRPYQTSRLGQVVVIIQVLQVLLCSSSGLTPFIPRASFGCVSLKGGWGGREGGWI